MDKLGMAYVMLVEGHHYFYNSIEQMREQIQFWRKERPDVKYSFVTCVQFDCVNIPECERIFSAWPR